MMNFFNLLADETTKKGSGVMMYVILGVFVLLMVAMYFMSSRNRKKQQRQQEDMFSRIGVGTEIKTIGGIIGTVVELDAQAGTYVLETGSGNNKSTMKIDKLAIYTADVAGKPVVQEAAAEQAPAEEAVEEIVPVEEKVEEKTEEKDA